MNRVLVSAAEPETSARRAADLAGSGGILFYALGGGLGHSMRAAAIARQLRRLKSERCIIFTNSRTLPPEPLDVLQLEDQPDAAALAALMKALLKTLRPRLLVVDAFPAGILAELPEVLVQSSLRRVTVLRRLQPRWIERWKLPELLTTYDAVALVEPGAAFNDFPATPHAVETAPVVIRDAAELLHFTTARNRLGHTTTEPLIALVASGSEAETRDLLHAAYPVAANVSAEATVRLITPANVAGQRVFPLLEYLPGFDLIIGACGYNLCHETAATGVPAIFIPQKRLYDDQWARAQGRPVVRTPDELAAWCRRLLSLNAVERPLPHYENGASEVARLLADFI